MLFYVMPYVEGQSLRERLRQEKQLAIPAALLVARDVADALTYAHARGIVHRDIKPENIMLSGEHALVADFGVARALEAADDAKLTATGIAVGTPTYMSPEQASGESSVDARSDIYALGCVVYEMLAGEAPFTGPTLQAVIARHVSQPPPPLRVIRPNVPEHVQAAVETALAKVPADRFRTANDFAEALEQPLGRPTPSGTWPAGLAKRWRKAAVAWRRTFAVAAGAAVLAGGWAVWSRSIRGGTIDANLLAIAPFNVLDEERNLTLWREGLVDLLSQTLNGAGPIRVVPPSTVIRGWSGRADQTSAGQLGRRTRAGISVWGSLTRVGGDSVKLSASTYDLVRRQDLGLVEVRGHVNAIGPLADSCALALLRTIGASRPVGAVRLATVQGTSLPALRAYLQGEQFFRRTAWDSALAYYERATELDTAFALAVHRTYLVRYLKGSFLENALRDVALRAGRLNHGLAPRESLIVVADSLLAALGNRGAVEDSLFFGLHRRLFSTLDASAARFPNDPEVWYQRGFALARAGDLRTTTIEESLRAFDRSIQLDSSFAPSYIEALEYAMEVRGESEGRRYLDAYVALRPPGPQGDAMRLAIRLMNPAAARSRDLQQILDTASAVVLFKAFQPLGWWFDSAETAVHLTRLMADGRDASALSSFRQFPQYVLALTLGWRGHAQEYYQVMNRFAGRNVFFLTQATLLGLPTRDTAQAVLARRLAREPKDLLALESGLALWSLLGDTASLRQAKRVADSTLRSGSASLQLDHARYVADGAAGYLALARHDTLAGLRHLLALRDSLCAECAVDRLRRVRLLIARKRFEEADRALDARMPDNALPIDPLWQLERARVAEKLGNRRKAVTSYVYVSRAWANADPPLQPVVSEAREALRRLGHAARP
jgi:serine/threonine-protein kinase